MVHLALCMVHLVHLLFVRGFKSRWRFVRICLESVSPWARVICLGLFFWAFPHLSREYYINSLGHNLAAICNLYSSRSIKLFSPLPVDVANTSLVNHVKSLCSLFAFLIIFLAFVITNWYQS